MSLFGVPKEQITMPYPCHGMKAGDRIELYVGADPTAHKVTILSVDGNTFTIRRRYHWLPIACKIVAWTIIIGFVLMLVACGGGAPTRPGEPARVGTTTVAVPKTTKCIKRADVPVLPAPTTVDPVGGTTKQLAAAAAADAEAYKLYAESAAAQIAQCVEE